MNIVISGASSGLGLYLCREYLQIGCVVWGMGRRPFSEKWLGNEWGGRFTYSTCDVSIREQVEDVFVTMAEKGFVPNIVILNAGLMEDDIPQQEFDHDHFEKIFAVNFTGAINIIAKSLQLFQAQNNGIFIGISSLSTMRSVCRGIAYPVSKVALNAAFEAFRVQLANTNIRFITVNLGGMSQKSSVFEASYLQTAKMITNLPNRRKNVIYYPLIPTLINWILKLFSDKFIYEKIIDKRRKLLDQRNHVT